VLAEKGSKLPRIPLHDPQYYLSLAAYLHEDLLNRSSQPIISAPFLTALACMSSA
jgi:hypothetical protein